jgi:hypothetical protein
MVVGECEGGEDASSLGVLLACAVLSVRCVQEITLQHQSTMAVAKLPRKLTTQHRRQQPPNIHTDRLKTRCEEASLGAKTATQSSILPDAKQKAHGQEARANTWQLPAR